MPLVLDDTKRSWQLNRQIYLALNRANVFASQEIQIETLHWFHLFDIIEKFFHRPRLYCLDQF